MSPDRIIRDYLEDILQAVTDARDFTRGMGFDDFSGDRKTVNAVVRSLEIIGEAVKKIPPDIKKLRPEVPWNEIAGMRDKAKGKLKRGSDEWKRAVSMCVEKGPF